MDYKQHYDPPVTVILSFDLEGTVLNASVSSAFRPGYGNEDTSEWEDLL